MNKICYSGTGGIFFGQGISSDYLKNHYITIIISLNEPFQVNESGQEIKTLPAVLVFPDTQIRISTDSKSYTAFVHIDPYSETGLMLQPAPGIIPLETSDINKLQKILAGLLNNENNDSSATESIIEKTAGLLPDKYRKQRKIDQRVLTCVRLLANQEEAPTLDSLACSVGLSASRLSHLFREETGIPLKKYIQHRKMVKSIHGIHHRLSLTDAAHHGGFSDQPHFIKIFKRMFGILPKKTRS